MPPALALTRLMLRDFRSWPALTVPFHSRIVLVSGPNGSGKTNLLEAVSLLVPGRGLRGARNAELARQRRPPARWAVAGRFATAEGPADIGTGTPPDGPPTAACSASTAPPRAARPRSRRASPRSG